MKTSETYYAVRIGNPKRHACYFMLNKTGWVPALFEHIDHARKHVTKGTARKVVKVKITEI